MERKEIYLDMNIIIDYMNYYKDYKNIELVKKINFIGKNNQNIRFPYSPAHIEEIAVINRKSTKSKKYINQNFRIICKLTLNYEYYPPYFDKNIDFKFENPRICYQRVMKDYDATMYAENLEYGKVEKWKSIQLSITLENLNKISPKDIFLNIEILNSLKKILEIPLRDNIPTYEDIYTKFYLLEGIFELIFDFLDYIGYKNDKQVYKREKHRSRMHDITHAIYATKASIIVTNDNNFRDKLLSIYTLLKVPTVILSKEEFLEYDI